ncbi:MAG: hypothetical protein M3Q45_01115 [Chloroflexota bacterium]|nr:hypothetical protein [Chloroflexota bacterium]
MVRTMPVVHNEEIELYIRTYYSLLRSSTSVRIRSLEETHAAMNSSLHQQAGSLDIDTSALVYSALRLPDCILQTRLMVMGQMEDVFVREGYNVIEWPPVKARARRRKFYFDQANGVLAAYVASVSDIDDLIPCLTTLQIEWNKLHQRLNNGQVRERLLHYAPDEEAAPGELLQLISEALNLNETDLAKLYQVWPRQQLFVHLQMAVHKRLDLRVRVLGSGLSDYRRSVQNWWSTVAEASTSDLTERPIYFVSSNIHSVVNLISGYTQSVRDELVRFVQQENPEDLWNEFQWLPKDDNGHVPNFLYYVLRPYVNYHHLHPQIAQYEQAAGVTRVSDPHCLDVEAQIIDMRRFDWARVDPRLRIGHEADWALLKQSDALIFNIDYPLGMAAYHVFSQVSTAVARLLGVYIIGKAATLNGRVGDVMIPNVVYDEHSRNSYLFRNCFTAQDVTPFLNFGAVFDNQKSVTVRGTILQNRNFMHIFYEEGYTDIEMEAGPYLSGIYEDVYPRRYPTNEIVNLFINAPYDIGLIHYASDTPISRRQTLLSKSLSYFGVDATYATTIAVLRRILHNEIERQKSVSSKQ